MEYDISEPLIDMVIPFPYWESKGKKQIASLNNLSRWYRHNHTKIKNGYKDLLRDFYVPEPNQIYNSLLFKYEIQRHNNRRADSMNLVPLADKWLVDLMVDIGWMKDDDKCYHMISPAVYKKGIVETQLRVQVFEIKE